ncbi:hypothetical protein [Desulfosporosinus nitroreducens]|uniref:hypothetical protein n=1 Tax=Desulfosporosinus nitroreducens TaxID=2018668 RepID=UPI0035A33D7A
MLTELGKASIGGAMEQQKIQDMFIARTGNTEIGTAMFDNFKLEALAAGQDVNKALQSSLTFLSSAQNVDQISKLNDFAFRLNAFDNAGNGIEGAALAIKGAMSGNITSLAKSFNMSEADIKAFDIDDLGKSGNIDGFIKAFDQLLEKQNMGQAAFDQMMKSPTKQLEALTNNMKSSFADAGEQAMEALTPLMTRLNNAFQKGSFQPFFEGLSMGLFLIVTGLQWLVSTGERVWPLLLQGLAMIGDVAYNVGIILVGLSPFILGIATAWGIYNAVIFITGTLIPMITAFTAGWSLVTLQLAGAMSFAILKQRVLNFVMSMNPIGIVIALIVGLITVLGTFAIVTNGIRTVFSSAFGFVVDVVQSAINFVLGNINNAINAINKVSGFFGDLLGIDAKQIQEIEFRADFSQFKTAGQDFIENISLEDIKKKIGMTDLGMDTSYLDQQKILNDWNGGAANFSTIDRVNEVGKINNTVDISSEDLKTMRELAEMKNIQNFVTLTPTVAMTTGDINNGQSVDSIIVKIKTMLETEISSSAQGVYA